MGGETRGIVISWTIFSYKIIGATIGRALGDVHKDNQKCKAGHSGE